jgi:predicted pyridoxine 5'-phosphate oxidase superfamily flavin-nucleotide-binding protein
VTASTGNEAEIRSLRDLESIYKPASEQTLKSVLPYLHDFHFKYLSAAPVVFVGSSSARGLRVTVQGGCAGFVQALDRNTVALPHYAGGSEFDSLCDIVEDGRTGMLFVFPGLDVFMRINGQARVTCDPLLLLRLAGAGPAPVLATLVQVEAAYFHCGRAINRSRMWNVKTHLKHTSLPVPMG